MNNEEIEKIKSKAIAGQYLHWASNFIEQASMRFCLLEVKQELRDISAHLMGIYEWLKVSE